jgi:hypothetical protein
MPEAQAIGKWEKGNEQEKILSHSSFYLSFPVSLFPSVHAINKLWNRPILARVKTHAGTSRMGTMHS